MKLQLNSHKVFFIGVSIIIFFLFLNRLNFYYGSKTAVGTVVGLTKYTGSYPKFYPIISFEENGFEFRVEGIKDLDVTYNDKVEMIYQPSDPSGAVVNSFYGFWFYPILFCIIPFMVWVSFVYSYITPKEFLYIKVGKQEEEEDSGKFKYVRFSKEIDMKK